MFHRSARLLLRPVFEEDWREVYHGINDEDVVRMLARAPWPYREQVARAWTSLPVDTASPKFLITQPGEWGSRLVGCIGFGDMDDGPELGYWIARPFWGRGFATEAGRAVVEIARMMGITRLVAGHIVDNPASGKVLEKIGFKPTGETRMQFSMGRGEEAMSRRYVNELGAAQGAIAPSCMPKAA